MKKLMASLLCAILTISLSPISLVAAPRSFQAGQISGVATVEGKPLPNITVRLRNVDTGQLTGSTTANASGQFSFTGLPAGNFVVETVAANGTILGTSTVIALAAGAIVTVTVTTTGTALAAAGGAGAAAAGGAAGGAAAAGGAGAAAAGGATAGGVAAATGGLGAVLTSTAGLVIAGGTLLTTTAIIVVTNDASSSQ